MGQYCTICPFCKGPHETKREMAKCLMNPGSVVSEASESLVSEMESFLKDKEDLCGQFSKARR